MARIATYVFLDLETSGLPSQDHNSTRITELSMVVVKRRHILETRPGELPRVQPKVTMCFNPGKMIHPEATKASGLDNDLLEYETYFNNNVFNTINSFLSCQEKPVCLIAQNGHRFDFPILKNSLEKLNKSFEEDLLCADSLDAYYYILNKPYSTPSIDKNLNNNESTDILSSRTTQIQIDKDKVQLDSEAIPKESIETTKSEEDIADNSKDDNYDTPQTMQRQNESTPCSKKIIIKPAQKLTGVRKRLFYDQKPKESYKLKDIYKRVLGRDGIEAHRAENDCIMAAEVAVAKARQFVDWVDKNNCAFSEVKAMTPGVPLGY